MGQFVSTAEHENISQAAQELYISELSLSKTIRRIEEEIGASLLERQRKAIELNDKEELYSFSRI